MELKWNEERHGTGVKEIDEQHQELFRQVNHLLGAMRAGKGREELDSLLKFPGDYAIKHFNCEEKHMESRRCSACQTNKIAHENFLKEFGKFMEEYKKTGPTSNLVLRLQSVLCKWLDDHISKVDAKLKDTAH